MFKNMFRGMFKIKKKDINNTNKEFNTIIISSFYTDIDDSTNTNNLIKSLTTYFINSSIDIICLQGFGKYSLIREFVNRLINHNKHGPVLYFAPDIPVIDDTNLDTMDLTWTSSGDLETSDLDLLTISKFPIVQFSKIKLTNIMNLPNSPKYIILSNILFNDAIISVYNVTLQENLIGVNNSSIRKLQIDQLLSTISKNIDHLETNIYDEYNSKNIHIVCGKLNINEFEDNEISKEYLTIFRKAKLLDTYAYIKKYRTNSNSNSNGITDIFGSRACYICIKTDLQIGDESVKIDDITKYIFEKYNIMIINSKINKLEEYENYPLETTLKIKYIPKNIINKEIKTEEL